MRTFLLLVTLMAFVCGCERNKKSASSPGSMQGIFARVAVIPKDTSHEYWKSIHAGANKAKLELASNGILIDIQWQGPLKGDDRDAQIQVVENATARRVNAIVLVPQ